MKQVCLFRMFAGRYLVSSEFVFFPKAGIMPRSPPVGFGFTRAWKGFAGDGAAAGTLCCLI